MLNEVSDTIQCTKCKRTRLAKYMVLRKTYSGKKKWRCRARSVCASKARRRNVN